jgi:hypothetical protein
LVVAGAAGAAGAAALHAVGVVAGRVVTKKTEFVLWCKILTMQSLLML